MDSAQSAATEPKNIGSDRLQEPQHSTQTATSDAPAPPQAEAVLTGMTKQTVSVTDDKLGNRTVISLETDSKMNPGVIITEAQLGKQQMDLITMTASKVNDYYLHEGFGKKDIIVKDTTSKTYAVNMRPMAIDRSPFKEETPGIEDIQPITGYNQALCHENSYVYTLNVPDRYKTSDERSERETLICANSTQTIPALAILRNNLLGYPTVTAEYPVISSPNPACAASYLHAVQHRVSRTGMLDMRFNMTATHKHKLRESYILGRIWTPLSHINIFWGMAADNFDAAQPILYPAFAEMGRITLDTRKELTSLVQNMKFVDRTFPPDMEQSLIRIMQMVGGSKMSLSRLYWRMWTVILETTFAEHQKRSWQVHRIQHTHNTVHLNGPTVLKGLFTDAEIGIEPFFITHNMLEANRGLPLKDLMYFFLCENFQAESVFGVTQHWPPLGDVKLILPSDMDMISSQSKKLTIRSNDVYRLLEYFALTLGQQSLIEEIGRTVSMFALRPEGEEAWLGHRSITLQLPPFRCRRSLHFAWAMQGYELKYKFKTPPYYKLAWIGSIRYLQTALAANTVLNELGVYSALQLEAMELHMPSEWYDELSRLFEGQQRGTEFSELMQRVGLRCDWGNVLNKITGSITIVNPHFSNFTRTAQWYEWLLFQRMLPEGTWMAGQIAHITAKTQIKTGRSYNPALCGIESGINDVYYRMLVHDICQIKLHLSSFSLGRFLVRDAKALATCAGFPLDGQFRYNGIADDLHAYYQFVPRTLEDCHLMMHEWYERTEFHWQMHCPKKYFHTDVGKYKGEIVLDSRIRPPAGERFFNMIHEGVMDYEPVKLADLRTSATQDVVVYGNRNYVNSQADESETSSENLLVGPVELIEMRKQVYPIHYCEEDTKPSVGARMLRYGLKLKKIWCGVSMLSAEELYNLSKECEPAAEFLHYVPPAQPHRTMAWSRSPGKKQRQRHKQREHRAHTDDEQQKAIEQAAQKKEAERQQAALEQLERQQASQAKKQAMDEIVRPVEVSKRKKEFYGWTASNKIDTTAMKNIDIWDMLDGMEDICLSAPGSKLALQNRYVNILQKLDSLDVMTLVKQVPMQARAEFCRCMYNIMNDCNQFLTLSTHNRNVHDQLIRFFGTAMDNLAHNCSMTDEELQASLENPYVKMADWKIIGTMDSMDYLMLLFELSATPKPDDADAGNAPSDKVLDGNVTQAQATPRRSECNVETAIQVITENQGVVIQTEPAEKTENFQCAPSSCSAPSPNISASSPGHGGSKVTSPRGAIADAPATMTTRSNRSTPRKILSRTTSPKSTPKNGLEAIPSEIRALSIRESVEQMRKSVAGTNSMAEPVTLPSGSVVLSQAEARSAAARLAGESSTALFEKTSKK